MATNTNHSVLTGNNNLVQGAASPVDRMNKINIGQMKSDDLDKIPVMT
jgi:hypothetical protein